MWGGLPPFVVEALAQFSRIAAQGELWPGFCPQGIPLVLHGAGEAFLINHPSPPEGFRPLDAPEGLTVHQGPVPPEVTANTAQVVGSALCAVAEIPDSPQEPAAYARLLLHECFHVFQREQMPAVPLPDFRQMACYPENDPENNALAIVENRLLVSALAGESGAVPGFLAVRQLRQSRLGPDLSAYEAAQEYHEGTPTYIEVRAGRPVAELTAALGECNHGGKWAAYKRFYVTGSAMALLLDRQRPGWQRRLAAGEATLQGLLLEAAGTLPPTEEVLARAGYPAILAAEREREAERQRRIADLMAWLQSGPGHRMEIDIRAASHLAWDPSQCLVVAPGIRLHTRWCCLYNSGTIRVEITGLALEDRTRQVVITRLPVRPAVTGDAPFRFEGEGLRGQAPRGRLEPLYDGYRIRLEDDPAPGATPDGTSLGPG